MNTLKKSTRKQIADITKATAKPPTPVASGMEQCGQGGRPSVKAVEEPAATPSARYFRTQQERKRISQLSAIRSAGRCFSFHRENSSWVIRFPDAPPNETPHFRVTVSRFYMSRYPITNARLRSSSIHVTQRNARPGRRSSSGGLCQQPGGDEILPMAQHRESAKNIGCRRKRNGNTPPAGPMAEDIHGAITMGAAIWQILPTTTPSSPGAIAQIDDGYPESSPVGAFPRGASPSGWKTWPETSGNGVCDFFEPYRGDAEE